MSQLLFAVIVVCCVDALPWLSLFSSAVCTSVCRLADGLVNQESLYVFKLCVCLCVCVCRAIYRQTHMVQKTHVFKPVSVNIVCVLELRSCAGEESDMSLSLGLCLAERKPHASKPSVCVFCVFCIYLLYLLVELAWQRGSHGGAGGAAGRVLSQAHVHQTRRKGITLN